MRISDWSSDVCSSDLVDLSRDPQTSYNRVVTDNRVVVNGLLGLGLEIGDHKLRWTSLYIRDTLKQARLALGTDRNQSDRDIMKQDTAWNERQLINTQFVGEFRFDRLSLDPRGSYAHSNSGEQTSETQSPISNSDVQI